MREKNRTAENRSELIFTFFDASLSGLLLSS